MKRVGGNFTSFFKKIAARKILLYSLTVVIIVLPVSLALVFASRSHTTAKAGGSVSVVLKSQDGTVIASESSPIGKDDGSLVTILNNVNNRKTISEMLPEAYSALTPLTAEISDASGKKTTLVCYFPTDGRTSYCVDENGTPYVIDEIDAEDFLSTSYAESLYASATQPKLITLDGETVLPISSSWYYKNIQNDFMQASAAERGSSDDLYDITGQVDLSFSIAPDACQVSAYDMKKAKIFDGTLEELRNLILTTDESIRVVINATWKNLASATYHGSYSYDFLVTIADRSTFSVSNDTLVQNRFVILEATNVEDISKIKFYSEQTLEAPTFIPSGNNTAKAILTYPEDIASSDTEFSFSISYRASMQSFTLKLSSGASHDVYLANFTQPLNSPLFTASSQGHLRSALLGSGSDNSADVYFNSDFLYISSTGFRESISFGMQVQYLNHVYPTFTSLGTEYVCDAYGISVPALNSGLVTDVGENDLLGKYVAVDHGMGIKTWYCHLSDVDVRENSLVVRGQSVGKTGASPITRAEGFWLYVTFNGKLLDPYSIIH